MIIGGSVVGVTVGCLLGASCLLFMDLSAADRLKKARELESILETVMVHGDEVIGCERSAVFWADEKKGEVRIGGGGGPRMEEWKEEERERERERNERTIPPPKRVTSS